MAAERVNSITFTGPGGPEGDTAGSIQAAVIREAGITET